MIDTSFWQGRRVFLTGHTGFKGAWLAYWLSRMGAMVYGYSLEPPTEPNAFSILGLPKLLDQTFGDIRDGVSLSEVLLGFKPEIVFHLAAQPLVRLSYKEPRLTFETNVMGTLNVYEAVRACASVRAIVTVTTDKCYENREWVWGYRESDPMGGFDPYSSSKGCAELLSAAYRNSFFSSQHSDSNRAVALATARAGNVIGGGDWALDRLVPDCVRSLVAGEEIVIRSPNAIRPWQHVLEPLGGYLLLAQALYNDGGEFAQGWNFGPGDRGVMSVESIVRRVIEQWGSGGYRIEANADLHEAQLLKLDISKARAYLRWNPVYSVNEAIDKTVAWYKSFYDKKSDMAAITSSQIRDYTEAFTCANKG